MCDDSMLPETVAKALREYGGLLGEHGITWGEPELAYVKLFAPRRVLPPDRLPAFWAAAYTHLLKRHPGEPVERVAPRIAELDFDELLRDALGGHLPAHAAALRLTETGHLLEGLPRVLLDGPGEPIPLLIDSRRERSCVVEAAGRRRERGAWLVDVEPDGAVLVDGVPVSLAPLVRRAPSARLRVRAPFPCRWSVTGAGGQGWFPEGAPRRHDYHGRPYFHGADLVLDVPAGSLTVSATRGMEYHEERVELSLAPGAEQVVELSPRRLYDAAASGWYGGDLHTHLNWAGDLVAGPADAAAIQHGEDLHVLNLLAGNVTGERVYDREALVHWVGRDLPWSDATHVARMGAEYRNDLLGHSYAFGLTQVPEVLHTGFVTDYDWPPNAEGLRRLREYDALVGYSHPFSAPVRDDDPASAVIGPAPRNCAARELVADAALGLVDSLDVLTHASIPSTAAVYRRLLGAGNRLAVTAGTDTMISFTRSGNQSNPPGWARVYAQVEGRLSAGSFAAAVRAGRTFATTGPWLELSVEGRGPGAVLDAREGGRLTVTATAIGPEVSAVRVRTHDGVRAGAERLGGGDERLTVTAELDVTGPGYVLAEVLCEPGHPRTLTGYGYALTSPVYIEVGGRAVARQEDVLWCLDWLELLEDLIERHARLRTSEQLDAHLSLLEEAREVYRARLV
jgi:hypothetical protein